MQLYRKTNQQIAALVTKNYSSSFYLSTLLFDKKTRDAIFGVYGFVRYADEIVDTFEGHDKEYLLLKFEKDLKEALNQKISLNPILDAFQTTVNKFDIPYNYIDAFLSSMKMDLGKKLYLSKNETEQYVYGSANVVGLMCLKVFCNENHALFDQLLKPAEMLGSAFQKVNFLRDLKADTEELDRFYFSNFDKQNFTEAAKNELIAEIENEFAIAYQGILHLPGRSKLAVLTAYKYYLSLLRKIKRTDAASILKKRIRISNAHKLLLMAKAAIQYKLNLL